MALRLCVGTRLRALPRGASRSFYLPGQRSPETQQVTYCRARFAEVERSEGRAVSRWRVNHLPQFESRWEPCKFWTNVMNRGADLLHRQSARMAMASPLPCGALVGGEVFDK